MRVIIAGSRHFTSYEIVEKAIKDSGFKITTILCGDCRGVDRIGKHWGYDNKIPVQDYPAKWGDLNAPNALIKKNKYGKAYNARAGFDRNLQMAQNADALIAVWDGVSTGTKNMIDLAEKHNLNISIHLVLLGGVKK